MGILRRRKLAGAPVRERGRFDFEERPATGLTLPADGLETMAAEALVSASTGLGVAQAEFVKAARPSLGRQIRRLAGTWDLATASLDLDAAAAEVASVKDWYSSQGVDVSGSQASADRARVAAFRDEVGDLPNAAAARVQLDRAIQDEALRREEFEADGYWDSPSLRRLHGAGTEMRAAAIVYASVDAEGQSSGTRFPAHPLIDNEPSSRSQHHGPAAQR